jgi:hypothetical protein
VSITVVADNQSKAAFAAIMNYLSALDAPSLAEVWSGITFDLLEVLNKNLNQNRSFIPTLLTSSKLFGEHERYGWKADSLSPETQAM